MRRLLATLWFTFLWVACPSAAQVSARVDNGAVTVEMREWWYHRMDLMEAQKILCVSGHYADDSTFVIDSLHAAKHCGFPVYQGALSVEELQATTTYQQAAAAWQLAILDHPQCVLLGSIVGLTADHRPLIWMIQRRRQ